MTGRATLGRATLGRATLPASARVLIVDDHPIVLQGVRRVLEDAGVTEIFEAGDPVAGYRLFHRVRPDVAIVDLAFRGIGLSGLSLIRRMRALEAKARILVLSMHHDPVIAARALQEGATGFTFKDLPVQDVLEAVGDVYNATPHLPHPLAIAIARNQLCPSRACAYGLLSTREIEIIALMLEGMDYKSISKVLSLGYRSVTNSVSNMRSKLGARNIKDIVLHIDDAKQDNTNIK